MIRRGFSNRQASRRAQNHRWVSVLIGPGLREKHSSGRREFDPRAPGLPVNTLLFFGLRIAWIAPPDLESRARLSAPTSPDPLLSVQGWTACALPDT
jgi:hypothetical protein